MPVFLSSDVSDDELEAGLMELKGGRIPGWRFAGEAGYKTTLWQGEQLQIPSFRRIWLLDDCDRHSVVTLRKAPGSTYWTPVLGAAAGDS